MGAIWGVPYLFIKVAVEDLSPHVVVFGRTSIAAVLVVVVAARTNALRAAWAHWRWVLAFAALEMAGPWLLLTDAETRLPSGLTGLLIACVPIVGAVAAFALGDRSALHPGRLLGIAVGLGGVALLVGGDLGGDIPWWTPTRRSPGSPGPTARRRATPWPPSWRWRCCAPPSPSSCSSA
jgi:drug/metabolite transporter (DMT)-like permease